MVRLKAELQTAGAFLARPVSRGAAVSLGLHALGLVVLAFCAWGAQRPVAQADLDAALVPLAATATVRFELADSELTGGGGGPTSVVEAVDRPQGLGLGGAFQDVGAIELPPPEIAAAGLAPGPGEGRGRGTGRGDGTGNGRKPPGRKAIGEGSFMVWTIPDDPLPGEDYTIVIEVRLPEKVTKYPRSDLSGLVTGTDGWRQPLPGNAQPLKQYLPVEDHTVQLEVPVPGAPRLVRDVVKVRSRLLKEERDLTIVF